MITGKYIRELRESARISQTELAGLANISQAHIAKIETEKVNPRLSTVNAILAVLQNREKILLCGDIMSRKVIHIRPGDSAKKAAGIMKNFSISQLPVMERGRMLGSMTESTVIRHLDKNLAYVTVNEIMEEPFPVVSEEDSAEMAQDMLEFRPAVLVGRKGRIAGIITKADLLSSR